MSPKNTDTSLMELQRFQILISGISDYAIYMLDTDGDVISWNSGAQQLKGYTADEAIGIHFSHFFTDEDRATGLPATALRQATAEGRFESEGWRVRKDGTYFWANAVVDAIRSEDGRLLGFAKITRDVTARRESEEALRRSEQQFRLLVQGVTDYAIYMLDPNGNITNWNTGAQRIKGYTENEVIGTHFSRFYTPEDRAIELPQKALTIALNEGRYEQEGWRLRKDGTRFFAHVIIDALHDDDGQLAGFAKITRDISEKREAAEMLKRTEQALQRAQKMEAIGQLTGGVAHDFNNLLQIISGNLHLLSLEVGSNETAHALIKGAVDGVKRGAKLASYLLAFGRRQPLDPKVVNIRRFVVEMEDLLRRTLGEAVEVDTIISGGLWNTLIDTVQLENALLNLAINARDAMPEGGKLTIEVINAYFDDHYVQTQPDVAAGQYVMLAVSDTGVGMSPEIIAQAFEPFFSTKPEGKGTGLGLSMVYGFVKQSGGHVQIYSEVGHGTTVKLYLPRSYAAEDVIPVAPNNALALGGSETILVAEDDPELCATVVKMLEQLGYRVFKVNDAAGALAIVESGIHIDVLFTDVVMPGPMRSPELARKAKLHLPDLAVLFTSGYTQNAIVHGGRLDPGVELLPKPYSHEALARKIRHVIANQKHTQLLNRALAKIKEAERGKQIDRSLNILLVEDEALIRENTKRLLLHLGHSVTAADSMAQALSIIDSQTFDVLIADIELGDGSGTVLAKDVKNKFPDIGIIYATGQTRAPEADAATFLQKPYGIESLQQALSEALKN